LINASARHVLRPGRPWIDWTHPLTNGLIGCWVPGLSGPIDLTGQVLDLSQNSSAGNILLTTTPDGPALNSLKNAGAGNATYYGIAPSSFKTWSNLTMFWRGFVGPSGDTLGNNSTIFGIAYDNAVGPPYQVVDLGMTVAVRSFVDWNSGGTYMSGNSGASIAVNFNTMNSIAATFPVSGTVTQYVNGVSVYSGTSFGGAPNTSATSTICIGSYFSGGAHDYTNTAATLACAWNRILSANEVAFLDADPYCFLTWAEGDWPAIAIFVAAAITKGSTLPIMGVG
jgi:hypothetical protein